MDYPFLAGALILGLVAGIGYASEAFSSWSKPVAVIATLALIASLLVPALR